MVINYSDRRRRRRKLKLVGLVDDGVGHRSTSPATINEDVRQIGAMRSPLATTTVHCCQIASGRRRQSSYDRLIVGSAPPTWCDGEATAAARGATVTTGDARQQATMRRTAGFQRLSNVIMLFVISRAILMLRCAAAVGELNRSRIV